MGRSVKRDVRFLAFDDGPFRKGDATVPVIGVVARGAQYVEGVLRTTVHVDGSDGTRRVLQAVRRSRFRGLLRAILLNGIFVGGFNLVDVERIHQATGLPVLAVVRTSPRPGRVRSALVAAFGASEGARRWRRVEALTPRRLPGTRLWATLRGIPVREAVRLLRSLTARGVVPEPLRLAHVIASGIVRGESRGKA